MQENPALIQPLIQQLAGQNPQLGQLIAQNPEALLQLLGAGGDDDEDGDYGEGFMGGEVMQVDLTPEEAAAVERVRFSFFLILPPVAHSARGTAGLEDWRRGWIELRVGKK